MRLTGNNPFLDLCAPGIAGLTPYAPGKPVSELERELGIKVLATVRQRARH